MPKPERGLGTATQWWHLSNQRLEDAEVLFSSRKRRYNGAVYLAGYAIECALKSAICVLKNLTQLSEEYKTHDFNQLLWSTGLTLPNFLMRKFSTLLDWSITLRYQTKAWGVQDARQFLDNVKEVKQWLESVTLQR
ncbi:HEPN domain-containing protein [Candidatus Poribacteria bacterium]|nr:HEPN domain-containing protein [Candidatus Poribacteria bacterium]